MQANQYSINRNGVQAIWVSTQKLHVSFWWHGLMFFASRVTNFTVNEDHFAECLIEFALLSQTYIALARKADTRPRMKQFGRALRQFSPYTTYHMAYAMLRDGHSIKEIYARKYMDFGAIDAAIKTARDNGVLAPKASVSEQAIQAVESLSCSHCHRSALDITIRVVHALNPIVYCSDCYEAFNLD